MTTRLVTIGQVIDMLGACAPGYGWEESDHDYSVSWNGQTYAALPKGPHGSRGKRSPNAEIEVGHVRKLARKLGFIDCARVQLGF